MAQYTIYLLLGYVELWLVAVPLGMSNGFAAPWPYYALLGSLALFVLAAALVSFSEKLAAIVAIVSSLMFLLWPIVGVIQQGVSPNEAWFPVFLAAVPAIILVEAGVRLYRSRASSWWAVRSRSVRKLRFLVAAAPFLFLILATNARQLLWIVMQGPPR